MTRLNAILASLALATPLFAAAQATTPAGQPRTNLEKQQTTQNGNAPKHGSEADASPTAPTGDPTADAGEKKKAKRKGPTDATGKSMNGEVSNYPGPSTDTPRTK